MPTRESISRLRWPCICKQNNVLNIRCMANLAVICSGFATSRQLLLHCFETVLFVWFLLFSFPYFFKLVAFLASACRFHRHPPPPPPPPLPMLLDLSVCRAGARGGGRCRKASAAGFRRLGRTRRRRRTHLRHNDRSFPRWFNPVNGPKKG